MISNINLIFLSVRLKGNKAKGGEKVFSDKKSEHVVLNIS